jgi:single-strand DNA-binding protein
MENNKVEIITGRLGLDPRLAYTKKGEAVCEMSVGLVNEQNETMWRKIVAFGKLAEQCSVHLRKGNEIFVRGRLFLRSFTNRVVVKMSPVRLIFSMTIFFLC